MSIRGHLLRLVVAVVLPLALLAAAFVYELIGNERATMQGAMRDVSRSVSLAVDTEVKRTITALEVLALSPSLTNGDIESFRMQAEDALRAHGRWSNFAVNEPDGTGIFNLRERTSQRAPGPFRDPALMQAVEQRTPSVSNVTVSRTSGKPMFYVSVPAIRQGTVRYVLTATTEYDLWTDWLKRQVPDGWFAAIDDREGRIFARSERADAFAGKPASDRVREAYRAASEGITKNRNIEGLAVYTAYHTSPFTGYHAVIIVPANLVESPADHRIVALVAGTLVALLLAVGFAFVAARPAVRGVARLSNAIVEVGHGESVRFRPTRITEIDEAGEAVQRTGELLQARAERLSALQKQLAERAEAAEQASRTKDQFLGMLGHELRNPLAAISNATAVLLMQSQGDTRQMHEIIQRQTRQLTMLVDDLLDVSRAAAGKLQVRKQVLDLAEIVIRVRAALDAAGTLDLHDVHIDVARAPICGDPERMAQVVRNLLENAVKYTPAGGSIEARVGVEGDDVVLRVKDTGTGIDPTLLPRIFEPFVQAPQSIDRRTGGLGLGLAIVKQVIALHEGTIEAHSDGEGRGSEFVVRIPVFLEPHAARSEQRSPARSHRALRIALIEDHDDSRLTLRSFLRGEGHRVQEAADGALGLVLLQNDAFDVAFVDIGLPGIDGWEVVRRARAAGIQCRFIALTGYGQAADRERAERDGFDDFLVKPASPDQVRAALDAIAPSVSQWT